MHWCLRGPHSNNTHQHYTHWPHISDKAHCSSMHASFSNGFCWSFVVSKIDHIGCWSIPAQPSYNAKLKLSVWNDALTVLTAQCTCVHSAPKCASTDLTISWFYQVNKTFSFRDNSTEVTSQTHFKYDTLVMFSTKWSYTVVTRQIHSPLTIAQKC